MSHTQSFRSQAAFAPEAKLTILGNLWRAGTPGGRFFEQVLSQNPSTVQDAIDKAAALAEPFSVKAVQGHLRWAFTANGNFLEVGGVKFVAPEKPAKAPKVKVVAKAEEPKAEEPVKEAAPKANVTAKAKKPKKTKAAQPEAQAA
jgi:hypothetical protein